MMTTKTVWIDVRGKSILPKSRIILIVDRGNE